MFQPAPAVCGLTNPSAGTAPDQVAEAAGVSAAPSRGSGPDDKASADVTVVGSGLIGLCVALALADRRLRVCLIGESRPGEASPAAAGMLATSLDDTLGPLIAGSVHKFAVAARDRYVSFLADLVERSGIPVSLNRLGLLEIAVDETEAEALKQMRRGQWLDRGQATALEPGLGPVAGAAYIETDGAVDNVALLRALSQAVDCASRIVQIDASVVGITIDATGVTCRATDGESYQAPHAVLAAGAWVRQIEGLPRPLPIDALRGQMFSIVAPPTARPRHVVYGPGAYLVPRGERTLIGATLERVGFDAATTPQELAALRARAALVWPTVASEPMVASWAGLRPVTPDLLPIIGADPAYPALVYACGHSRNGILMGPLTGDRVAAIIAGEPAPADIDSFRVERFDAPPVRSA